MERMLDRTQLTHWHSTRLRSVTIDQPSGIPPAGALAWVPQ